jgi:hypothetical protein
VLTWKRETFSSKLHFIVLLGPIVLKWLGVFWPEALTWNRRTPKDVRPYTWQKTPEVVTTMIVSGIATCLLILCVTKDMMQWGLAVRQNERQSDANCCADQVPLFQRGIKRLASSSTIQLYDFQLSHIAVQETPLLVVTGRCQGGPTNFGFPY